MIDYTKLASVELEAMDLNEAYTLGAQEPHDRLARRRMRHRGEFCRSWCRPTTNGYCDLMRACERTAM